MKKQVPIISLCFILATSSMAATPLSPRFLLNMHHQAKSNHLEQKKAHFNDDYADFSGHWVGSCDNDPDEKTELNIEQDPNYSSITIDNAVYPIDAISIRGVNENFQTESATFHMRWSPNGQELLTTVISYYKEGSAAQGGLDSITGKFNLSLNNEQLVTNYEVSVFTDGAFDYTTNFRCVYNNLDKK